MRRLAIAATVLAVLLAGCGGSGSGSGDGTLTFYYDNGPWGEALKDMSAKAAGDIGVGLELSYYGNQDTYHAQVNSGLKTRTVDLFDDPVGERIVERVEDGLIAETTEIWDEAIAAGTLDESLKEHFTVDGKQYCVPFEVKPVVMYYNKAVFEQHDLQPPTTWAELMEHAETLKAAGITPFYQAEQYYPSTWFSVLARGTDPELYKGLSTGEVKFTDPGVIKVMQRWKEMIDRGYMTTAGTTFEQGLQGIKSGRIAMTPQATWFIGSLNSVDAKMGTDYGMFAVPPVNPELSENLPLGYNVSALCANRRSNNLDAALDYLAWSISAPAQEIWSKGALTLPINTKVRTPAGMEVPQEAITNPDYQPLILLASSLRADQFTALTNVLGGFVADPGSYRTAMEKMQAAMEQ